MNHISVAPTYGALFAGGVIAASLSGIVALQSLLYIKLFPQDHLRIKLVVGAIWALDLAHSVLVYVSIWIYVISGYGNYDELDTITITLPLTVLLTGFLTFIVHCFFAHRIYRLSNHNWRITVIIVILAILRVSSSSATTVEMIHTKTFSAFKASFRWLFTLGLAMSCAIDILIAVFLTYSLQSLHGRSASSNLDRIINTVILYTLETNSLTGAATIVSMICWLAMPNNLVFMGLHFIIGKLYANSLLAILNTRKQLQNQRARVVSADLAVTLPRFNRHSNYSSHVEPPLTTKVEITVEQIVEHTSDTLSGSPNLQQSSDAKHPSMDDDDL